MVEQNIFVRRATIADVDNVAPPFDAHR